MATSTRRPASLLLPLVIALLFVSSAAHDHQKPSNDDKVKRMCDATPDRDFCYQCMPVLTPYAGSTRLLARASVSLSLHSAKAAATYLGRASAHGGALLGAARVIGDCVDLLQKSLAELDRLGQPGGPEARLCAGNVQDWAGKVIADANASLKSLQAAFPHGSPVVDVVTGMLQHTVRLTINAKVFVGFVDEAPKN